MILKDAAVILTTFRSEHRLRASVAPMLAEPTYSYLLGQAGLLTDNPTMRSTTRNPHINFPSRVEWQDGWSSVVSDRVRLQGILHYEHFFVWLGRLKVKSLIHIMEYTTAYFLRKKAEVTTQLIYREVKNGWYVVG